MTNKHALSAVTKALKTFEKAKKSNKTKMNAAVKACTTIDQARKVVARHLRVEAKLTQKLAKALSLGK
jgi:hypothetical protein